MPVLEPLVIRLAIAEEEFVVIISKSNTDQVGVGRKIGIRFGEHIETCPVRAIQAWIEERDLGEGLLFRFVNKHGDVSDKRLSDQVVADVVKRSSKAAGKFTRMFAVHSLRAGLITQAAMARVSERAIQDCSGHKSPLVMRRISEMGHSFEESLRRKWALIGDQLIPKLSN